MSNDAKAQALADRYPYMFRQPEMLDLYPGWLGPLETLCAKTHARLQGGDWVFHFLRIKEKLGTCQIYFHLGLRLAAPETSVGLQKLANLRKAIENDIETARVACSSSCMVCARDAITRHHGAVLATLCEQHALSESMRDPWSLAKMQITWQAKP